MPVPANFDCVLSFQNNELHHVGSVSSICPYCEKASAFAVKSYINNRNKQGQEIRLIIECNYAPSHEQSFVFLKIPLGTWQLKPTDFFYIYPSRDIKPRHAAVPIDIGENWEEAQKAMAAGAVKAAAVMCRRVLYGVLLNKSCTLYPLKDGMKQLITQNRLPAIFDGWLPAIKDDGHDAAHPDRALAVSIENII
jgi:hypothetical protein